VLMRLWYTHYHHNKEARFARYVHVFALVWVRQNVAPPPPEEANHIAAPVVVVLSNHGRHPKPAVNAALAAWLFDENGLFGLEERQLLEHVVRLPQRGDPEVVVLFFVGAIAPFAVQSLGYKREKGNIHNTRAGYERNKNSPMQTI